MCKYCSLPFILFCALFFSVSGQGLKYETPRIEGFHPLDEEPFAPSALTSENPVILKLEFNQQEKVFKDTAIIDFENVRSLSDVMMIWGSGSGSIITRS